MWWLSQENIPLQILLGPVGLLAFLLIVVVWGGRKRWWVFGRELDACDKREEFWKEMAMRSIKAAEEGTGLGKKVVDVRVEDIALAVTEELRKRGMT